jgi:hypothetical protein
MCLVTIHMLEADLFSLLSAVALVNQSHAREQVDDFKTTRASPPGALLIQPHANEQDSFQTKGALLNQPHANEQEDNVKTASASPPGALLIQSNASKQGNNKEQRPVERQEDPYSHLRFCRISPLPQHGMLPIPMNLPNMWDRTCFDRSDCPYVGYQCAGPIYDKCAAAVRQIAAQEFPPNNKKMNYDKYKKTNATWARVGVPLAPAHSTILFVGNSHLGQLSAALLCQYQDTIQKMVYKSIQMTNGITVERSVNEAWHFDGTKDIARHIQRQFNHHVHSYSAIVLGDFNGDDIGFDFSLAHTRNETFYRNIVMEAAWSNITLNGVLTLADFARHFPGPIIRVMGWGGGHAKFLQVQAEAKQLNRDNIVVLDGDRYAQALGWCSHNGHATEVFDGSDRGRQHRCIGGKGSQPDLVAFDLVEVLGKLLPG